MPELLDIVLDGINRVLNHPTHPFSYVTAYEFIWDGTLVNCTDTEFSAKAICAAIAQVGAEKIDATHYKTSIFKQANGSIYGQFKVHRRGKRLFEVIEFNEDDTLNMYDQESCNKFHGTEGSYFAPFTKKISHPWIFLPEMCRSFEFTYEKKTKFRKVPGLKYVRNEIDDTKPENLCYCRGGPETCPMKGNVDLSICRDAPFTGSSPHFYASDVNVKLLNPDKEKHESFMILPKVTKCLLEF